MKLERETASRPGGRDHRMSTRHVPRRSGRVASSLPPGLGADYARLDRVLAGALELLNRRRVVILPGHSA